MRDREGERGRADRRGAGERSERRPPTLWHTVNDVPQAEEMTELGGKQNQSSWHERKGVGWFRICLLFFFFCVFFFFFSRLRDSEDSM